MGVAVSRNSIYRRSSQAGDLLPLIAVIRKGNSESITESVVKDAWQVIVLQVTQQSPYEVVRQKAHSLETLGVHQFLDLTGLINAEPCLRLAPALRFALAACGFDDAAPLEGSGSLLFGHSCVAGLGQSARNWLESRPQLAERLVSEALSLVSPLAICTCSVEFD